MNFEKFDNLVNADTLNKINEAKANGGSSDRQVEAGEYYAKIEKMELGATKDGRPMFKVQMRITEGEFKKWCLFMNRVIYGTKNDSNMIASVLGWLEKLETEIAPEFKTYSQFADNVLDIFEEVEDLELLVAYDPEEFNSISIMEVYE